jgi:hypothetical protein
MTGSATVQDLLAAFRALPPWPSDRDLSDEDWLRYVNAARLVQHSEPADAKRALARFLDEAEGFAGVENETRLFLLLRVVFDLPDRAPADQRRTFKGWVNWPEPDTEGNVNLSWPVSWSAGQPILLARFEGADGPRYAAVEEYRHLLARFPFRELGTAGEG